MTDNQISITALALCIVPAVLHSFEVVFPILARWIVNYVLPWFKPGIPKAKELLTPTEQLGMLDSAIASVPDAKKTAAKDYIFLLLFEQRQNSLVLLSLSVGIIYGFQQPLVDRTILHLVGLVMSVLFMLVNANHAGIPFLGNHPRVSRNGRNVGIVFVPFWLAGAILNYIALAAI